MTRRSRQALARAVEDLEREHVTDADEYDREDLPAEIKTGLGELFDIDPEEAYGESSNALADLDREDR